MFRNRKQFGDKGEQLAVGHLKKLGYKIISTNYRCKIGEIDIIAHDGQRIVFIEVKTRGSDKLGSPAEAVNTRKQRKISRIAFYYLDDNNLLDSEIRFDVIAILAGPAQTPKIEHIPDAFEYCV